uniref:Uncharacterized protein n=1 Tax=Anguilla anguilla TaxID=7936 RepID=A0A0E9VQF1_ANGAN
MSSRQAMLWRTPLTSSWRGSVSRLTGRSCL